MVNVDELVGLEPVPKIAIGIEGLEDITRGGLPQGRSTLILGSAGTGKTIFGAEFLYRGVTQHGRNGVFVTFEERPADIVRNVKRLGWDLGELAGNGRLRFVDAAPVPIETDFAGAYDLSGLTAQIKFAIKKVDAELLVLDSFSALFHRFDNARVIRWEIFRITQMLRDLGVTSLLTAERDNEYGTVSRFGVEEYVTDNVIVLRNVLVDEKCRRTVQVLKMRGDAHFKGEYPFTITDRGLSIVPLATMQLKQVSTTERLTSGNDEIDLMTSGGLFRDAIALISGPTGSGKTLLCTTFAEAACRAGERVLFLAFEESHDQLLRNANGWGIDFAAAERTGHLRLLCRVPESMGLEEHLVLMRREIETFKPDRLVVDSVSALGRVASLKSFREFIIGLATFARLHQICTLVTSTTPRLSGGDSITEAHISTITDVIILLRYVELSGFLRRGIAVIKMRGSQHEKKIREFTIDSRGLHLGEPFKDVHNVILGVPRAGYPSESENLGEMFG